MAAATFPDELIGEEIEVIGSKNKHNLGMRGIIVDETKMTLVLSSKGVRKVLLKSPITIKVQKTGKVIVGANIVRRSEERIKK